MLPAPVHRGGHAKQNCHILIKASNREQNLNVLNGWSEALPGSLLVREA